MPSGESGEATAALLKEFKGKQAVVYDFAPPASEEAVVCDYSIEGQLKKRFTVPGRKTPLRFGYTSCNGFASLKEAKKIADKNERWRHLEAEHQKKPLHLLLMGGDQVYADSIWETVPSVGEWAELNKDKRIKAKYSKPMQEQVSKFYFDLYINRWGQPEVSEVLGQIPTVMMWDDHDIFDGWGSYEPSQQGCPVYQGIFEAAREHFQTFQLRTANAATHPSLLPGQNHFSMGFTLGGVAVAVLDMRSERSQEQVLSRLSWDAFYRWLDGLQDVKHLLVLSSIPVVYPDFELIEDFLGFFPGQQEIEDDLKDHWLSRSHRMERLRMIHRLLAFAHEKRCRVTLLSGDVHVAAVGAIQSDRSSQEVPNANVINQLISSAIVHPAPPAVVLFFLKRISDKVEQVDRGITAEMLDFTGTDKKFIGARNWLSLTLDAQQRIWAEWHVENEKETAPYSKVIHPCVV